MKKGLKIFLIIFIILLSFMGLGLIAVSPYLSDFARYISNGKAIAASSKLSDFRSTETSIVYDLYGDEITTVSGAKELYYLDSYKIPEVVKDAFVLIEDRKFYKHGGIDVSAIVRAGLVNFRTKSKAQGASTITQQVARNIYLSQEVTWERKITEIVLSLELEKRYSKQQILEFYINNIYFANGLYGIEAAAQGYFDKSAGELSISQLVFLTGIPNNPSKYDPFEHLDRTVERRDYILGVLHDYNCISDDEYQSALAEEIVLNPSESEKHDSVETYVYYCATRALMKAAGFNFRYDFLDDDDEAAYKKLYDDYYSKYQRTLFTGGYRIYTAIDMDKQQVLMDSVDNTLAWSTETNDEGVYKLQASAVCIDNATGFVTAIVGGRNQGLPGYTLNRAYQSFRQPGSAIKPLVVYAPYLGLGHNPDELIDDSPMAGGPSNFENRYPGEVTLTEALAWSSNVAAWKLFEQLTPEYGMAFVKLMHFRKASADEHYMAACLGGWSYGASAIEMSSAYATLANDGVYREPTAVIRITDSKGRTIVDNSGSGNTVYEKNAARMVSKMLQYGVEHGIATGAQLDDAIVAVKTGTTTDNKDGWTVGYSAYYTTAVWVGYDIPKKMDNLTGGTYPMTIWKSFMQEIHDGLELKEFPEYTRYAENSSKSNALPDDFYNNENTGEQESTTGADDIQNALGDKSYDGSGGDGEAGSSTVGDGNAANSAGGDMSTSGGSVGGDTSTSTSNKGDGSAAGVNGGDTNSTTPSRGDTNASGTGAARGDGNASGAGAARGDTNASGAGTATGDTNASGTGVPRGDTSASGTGTAGGDGNASGMGGDTSVTAPNYGDTNASGSGAPRGDTNASGAGTAGGDGNASGMGGDTNVTMPNYGDTNASGAGTPQGDTSASGTGASGGDTNAFGANGDTNVTAPSYGETSASGVGTAGGDQNAGAFGGDVSAEVSQESDADVVLP